MKKIILLLLLITTLGFGQTEIFHSPVQVMIGDTAWVATVDSANQANQIGTIITPPYLRPFDTDIFGFRYPVMDSSSQFTLVMGLQEGDSVTTFRIFPDSLVTFYFEVDSTLTGLVFIDPKFTEKFNRFQIAVPDTVDENKKFYWLLKNRN